ncbi:RNA-directed DNA polymerase, eukaryota [Tanacetum coccineum]|uniref:RNA-directed DNA polymerase, eukaryota n=1 Tax=Tanacetum coccineum TaxID=301880 RepID=A0ABQ5A7U4_9ASTR
MNDHVLSAAFNSTWSSIITEVNSLKVKGVDLISHCKIRVGKGTGTSFWKDLWIGDNLLKLSFPRLFALEENKDISVADKMNTSISSSFRRQVRGGVESQQLDQLSLLLDTVILSNMDDRWFWDLNGDGVFQVKDVRSMLDEAFLPKMEVPTRWIKSIPIKVNVFAWKLYLDRLPTRSNLSRRNVSLPSLACPLVITCSRIVPFSLSVCSVAERYSEVNLEWDGTNVKEKNHNQTLNNEVAKDSVVPSATVAYGNNNGTQDENMGQCSYTAPPNEGNVPISINDPNNSSPRLSGPTSYANLVTGEPSRNVSSTTRKSVNFRTLITSVRNAAGVLVPLESI